MVHRGKTSTGKRSKLTKTATSVVPLFFSLKFLKKRSKTYRESKKNCCSADFLWVCFYCFLPVFAVNAKVAQEIHVDQILLENQEAAQAYREAKQYDSNHNHGLMNREQAVYWYEQAIQAQPDAQSNLVIAERIAQIWTFYADPPNQVKPDPVRASQWWQYLIDRTESGDIAGARARLGQSSSAFMQNDPVAALELVSRVAIDLNPDRLRPLNPLPLEDAKQKRIDKARVEEAAQLRRIAIQKVDFLGSRYGKGPIGSIVALNRVKSALSGDVDEAFRQIDELIAKRAREIESASEINDYRVDDHTISMLRQQAGDDHAVNATNSPNLIDGRMSSIGGSSENATKGWKPSVVVATVLSLAVIFLLSIYLIKRRILWHRDNI